MKNNKGSAVVIFAIILAIAVGAWFVVNSKEENSISNENSNDGSVSDRNIVEKSNSVTGTNNIDNTQIKKASTVIVDSDTKTTTSSSTCGSNRFIHIDYPNGGESFNAGDTIHLKWHTCKMGSSGTMPLDIGVGNDGTNRTFPQPQYFFPDQINSGDVSIKIPELLPTSNHYGFRMQSLDYLGVVDFSDKTFSIKNSDTCLGSWPAVTIQSARSPYPINQVTEYTVGQKNVELGKVSITPSATCNSLKLKTLNLIIQGYAGGNSMVENAKLVDQNGNIFGTLPQASGKYNGELIFTNTNGFSLLANSPATFTLYGDISQNAQVSNIVVDPQYNDFTILKDGITLDRFANMEFKNVYGDISAGAMSDSIGLIKIIH